MLPAYRNLQINLQHKFYIKVLIQATEFKTQRKFKTEFEIQYDNYNDDKR